MNLGGWNIDVNTHGMPQVVASAMANLEILGATYESIAYLGSQLVNGTNHAVLAEQIITTGRDTKNIVLMIFNEKPNDMEATLVSIDRIVEGGMPLGGIQIDVNDNIHVDVADALGKLVGSKIEPIAMLGKQVVNGVNYILAATVTPVVPDAQTKAVVLTVNPEIGSMSAADIMTTRQEASLGYAFTWLKNGLGKPLGEWP